MPKVKQLTVTCVNRPGELAQIAGVLGKAGVNILAFSASSAGAKGCLQLVMDNANKAKEALEGAGLACTEEVVLDVILPNVPGALARFAGKLAARDINIGAGYQTTVQGAKKARVVLAVSHIEKASQVR